MAGGECSVAGTGKTAPRCPHKPGGGWRWTDRSTETKSLKDSEQQDKVARQLPEGPGRVSPEGPAPPGPDSVPPETALQGEKETHRTASNVPR